MAGRLLASGRAADVFDAGHDLVLRRYRTAYDASDEVALMRDLAELGYPVPRVEATRGGEILMARVEGPTMLEAIFARPWTWRRHADALADLHARLHDLPGGFVHRDLHPENVILSPTGPVVIDWSMGRRGEPGEIDVAQAWVILASATAGTRNPLMILMTVLLRRAFIGAFLGRFDMAAIRAVLPDVARARLLDPNLRPAEAAAVRRLAGI